MSKRLTALALGISLVLAMPADAGRINPKAVYKVKWRERDGQVLLTTVCDNYRYGSLDRRNCRSYAVDVFREKCSYYIKLHDQSGGDARLKAQRQRDKFCVAYSSFSP